jgi:antitoxin HicB
MRKESKTITKKILEYTVVFEPDEKGGYVSYVPALPGCASEGDTFEEAVAMIKDAIYGYLEVLKDENQEIPIENNSSIITKVSIINPVYSAA